MFETSITHELYYFYLFYSDVLDYIDCVYEIVAYPLNATRRQHHRNNMLATHRINNLVAELLSSQIDQSTLPTPPPLQNPQHSEHESRQLAQRR